MEAAAVAGVRRVAERFRAEAVKDAESVGGIRGGVAMQTVSFALDGVPYEVDLSDDDAAALRAVLGRYTSAGRRVGGRKKRTASPRRARRPARPAARSTPK